MALQWCAVNTKPKKEDFAARQLEAKGLEVFLPRISVTRKRGASKFSLWEPLFPGYLFVKLLPEPVQVQRVNWTPGVRRLLCAGDTPVPVPDEAIALIRQRVGPGGRLTPKPQAEFPAGSRVAVRHGPFAGLLGVVEKPMSGRGRVRVLLELLQRQTAVEIDAVDLDRLGWAGA
ncbi:NusG antitermination factor [Candidatus Desulforudis audaxviator MP104C]|uniref:Transcription termination/antitermination protein NusG n=1 Tax=Desulforudis audaxviator (strain MP104C) TaxID=477974 RepID=B1I6V9_DESAP|nr:transcription termination/antitermination NusG family protein [Candidatus Desulforudis audaxviator]ACA60204.1 NusG antitermination factor [Candidatus Desulforudis audaxviator MP104C]AZK60244.1 NusG antitermination factor [Candidatus Desulforudis audaxviator]